MTILIFHSETNDFTEILNDKTIKKRFEAKIKWQNHMLVSFPKDDKLLSYIILKYGTSIVEKKELIKDFAPIRGKDYETYRDTRYKEYLKKRESEQQSST